MNNQPKPTTGEIGAKGDPSVLATKNITPPPLLPKPTGEWTEGMVFAYWESEDWQGLADAHNAALAAEREKVELLSESRIAVDQAELLSLREKYERSQEKVKEYFDLLAAEREKHTKQLRSQLAAERDALETHMTCENCKRLELELAKAQAAMIDPCPICGKELRHYNTCPQKRKDTAALDAALAAAQQPLVDALKQIADQYDGEGVQAESIAKDALAMMKEWE